MKLASALAICLTVSIWSAAQETKKAGPAAKNPPSSCEVISAKVAAVFKYVDDAGFDFIAYQINFNGNPVIVEDPTARTNAKIGDEIRVVVVRTDLSKSANKGKKVISFVVGMGKA